jgi:5'-deoxynucleotidase YfbR-like HD superfamily hydrolase
MAGTLSHILNRALAHIMRFSAHPQHFPESVAEHSFYTAYFTLVLCRMLEREGEKIDTAKAMSMALVHDTEEMFSGDILGPFKHHSSEVKEAVHKVNLELIHDAFEGLRKDVASYLVALWSEEGRGESMEAQVVKMADRLSLLSKCAEEVKAGNSFFENIYDTQLKQLAEDNKPWWGKIKEEVLSVS